MKKIYMIYEEDYGHTGVTFEDEASAEEYVELLSSASGINYFIRKKVLYTDIQEYMSNKPEELIRFLKASIFKLENNHTLYNIRLTNGTTSMYYNQIKETVNENRLRLLAFHENGHRCEVVKADLDIVKAKFEEINKKAEEYRALLETLEEKVDESNKKSKIKKTIKRR